MKKLLFTVLIPVLVFAVVSCPNTVTKDDDPTDYYPDEESVIINAYDNAEPYGVGSDRNYYRINVVQLHKGTHCEIWVDRTVKVSKADAQKIAAEFDQTIEPRITNVFGDYNYLFTAPQKIILLLLDIKDNYDGKTNQSYVAGYFDARDLLVFYFEDEYPYGNGAPMLYIDTYPNTLISERTYSTIAHELQHLISFVNNFKYRLDEGTLYSQDTWIDEGLSSAAEYIYRGGHDTSRIKWFNEDPKNTISKGNNFFVWGEDRPEGSDTILDDYATVYMFFQWLRLQSGGGNSIYTTIATSSEWDHQAVTAAATAKFGSDVNDFSVWRTLLGTWHQANYRNEAAGRYGYGGDGPIIKPRVWAVSGGNYNLYPGGAVYSKYSNSAPTESPGIVYEKMNKGSSAAGDPYPDGDTERLLMFNTISDIYDNYGRFDNGTIITANLPSTGPGETKSSVSSSVWARNILNGDEPYAVDVRDVRGRRGREKPVNIQSLKIEK